MKNIIILLLAFIFNMGQAQTLSLAYEIISKPNKNDKNTTETSIGILSINEKKSYFFSPLLNNPTKQLEIITKNKDLSEKVLKSGTLTTYIIEKDLSNKNGITHFFKFDETFAYKDHLNLKWKIGTSTKDILGYKCREANTTFRGRTYTAYYAEDIPVNEGPYKFHGLPGLILDIHSNDGDYSFTAISIEKKNEDLDLGLNNPIITSREKFLAEMKLLEQDPSKNQKIRDKANGGDYKTIINGREVSNEEKYAAFNAMIKDFMKTHNNPIETDDIWIR